MSDDSSSSGAMADAHDNATNATSLQLTRRSLLVKTSALLGLSLLPIVTGCGGDDTAPPSPAPPPPRPRPAAAEAAATVSFRSVETAARVDSRYAGLSYEKNDLAVPLFTGDNAALIRLFRLLGPSVLRIGANQVDRSSWNGVIPDLTPFGPEQINALAAFVQATQWQVIYGVNLSTNTPANAADEAAYVAARLGPSLLAWEIGNEPDLFVRHGYRPEGWGYEEFLEEWLAYRAAMSAASPGVPFSGPAASFEVERYVVPFARDVEGLAMLTSHYYRGDRDDPDSTLRLLLQPHRGLVTELNGMVQAASAAGIPMGMRYDEANSFFGGGVPNVSNAYGTALWVMNFMFTCAINGCTGVNMHGGGSGPGYTPIADRGGVVVEARPEFYGIVMFAQAAQGVPLEGVVAATSAINLTTWGVRRDDRGLNAVLINTDDDVSVRVNLTTGVAAERFDLLWLNGPELSASSGVTLGGVAIGNDGSWAPQPQAPLIASGGRLDVLLPPASAVLLRSL
jgi:hypothetical protein